MTPPARPRGALFGVAYFVLAILGTLTYPMSSAPDFAGPPQEFVDFYLENSGRILGGNTLYLLASALLLAFAANLWAMSRRAEGGDGRIAAAGFGGAVAGVAMLIAGASLDAMAALRADEQGDIDPQVATVLSDASSILYGLASPMAFSVLLLATALISLRAPLLPRWWAIVSIVLAAAMLIPPIAWVAVIIFTFWPLITGLLLYLRRGPANDPPAQVDADGAATRT